MKRVHFPLMTLRFRRSLKLLPGVRLNLGMHGAGFSVGPRGLHVGVNRRGVYTSAGIPGTGLYAVHHIRSASGEPRVAGDGGGCLMLLLLLAIFIAIAAVAGK